MFMLMTVKHISCCCQEDSLKDKSKALKQELSEIVTKLIPTANASFGRCCIRVIPIHINK